MKTFIVQTKLDKDAVAERTNLTVDFTDCPQATLEHLATQHLVVRLQGAWRKSGSIPANFTAKVSEYAAGSRVASVSPEAAIAALTPEQRKELFAKYKDEMEDAE
jgi:hypothetical protein